MPRGKIQSISKNQLEQAKKILAELPEPVKNTFTVSEALEEMKDKIVVMMDKGHLLEDIVEALNKAGISITAARFKILWGKLYPTRKRKSRKVKVLVGVASES